MDEIHSIFTQLASPASKPEYSYFNGYSGIEDAYNRILSDNETFKTCISFLDGYFNANSSEYSDDYLWSCTFTLEKAIRGGWESRPDEVKVAVRMTLLSIITSTEKISKPPKNVVNKIYSTITFIIKHEWGLVDTWNDYFVMLKNFLESGDYRMVEAGLALQKVFIEDCILQVQNTATVRKQELREYFLAKETVNFLVVAPVRQLLSSNMDNPKISLLSATVLELCIVSGYSISEEDLELIFRLLDSKNELLACCSLSILLEHFKKPRAIFLVRIAEKLRQALERDFDVNKPDFFEKTVNLVHEIVVRHLIYASPGDLLPLLSLFFKYSFSRLRLVRSADFLIALLDVWESLADIAISTPELAGSYAELLVFVSQALIDSVDQVEVVSQLSIDDHNGSKLVFRYADLISKISGIEGSISNIISTHSFATFDRIIEKLKRASETEVFFKVFEPLKMIIVICGCVYAVNTSSNLPLLDPNVASSFLENLFAVEELGRSMYMQMYFSTGDSTPKKILTQLLVEIMRGFQQMLPFLDGIRSNKGIFSEILCGILNMVIRQVETGHDECQKESLKLLVSIGIVLKPDFLPQLEPFAKICRMLSEVVIPLYSPAVQSPEHVKRLKQFPVELRALLMRGVMYGYIHAESSTEFVHLVYPIIESFLYSRQLISSSGSEERTRALRCLMDTYATFAMLLRACTGLEDRKVVRMILGDAVVSSIVPILEEPNIPLECIEKTAEFLLALFYTLRREVEAQVLWNLAVHFLQNVVKEQFFSSKVVIPTAFSICKLVIEDRNFYGKNSVDFIEELALSDLCTNMLVRDGISAERISHIEGYRMYFELLREIIFARSGREKTTLTILLQSLAILDIDSVKFNLETLRIAVDKFNIFRNMDKETKFVAFERLMSVSFSELSDLVKEETFEILFLLCRSDVDEFVGEFFPILLQNLNFPGDDINMIREKYFFSGSAHGSGSNISDLPSFKFSMDKLLADLKFARKADNIEFGIGPVPGNAIR